MGWTQIQDEIEFTDYRPTRHTRVKKMIWSDQHQEFQTHYFLRVTCDSPRVLTDTIEWLEQQYGPAGYMRSWWRDPQNSLVLWLADSLATFWQIKYGHRS